MKTLVLLFFVFLFTTLVFAQEKTPDPGIETKTELRNGLLYTTVTLRPKSQIRWTGEVWRGILGNYGFGGTPIKAGKDLIGTICRGWVLWDLSPIPSDAIIQTATIRAYCNSSVSQTGHRLSVKKLTIDPRTASENALFNSIGSSTVYYTDQWDAMTSIGYKEIPYLSAGLSALQNDLGHEYHGVGILETGDNDAPGTFRGWTFDSGNNPEPMLIVTYSLPVPDLTVLNSTSPNSVQPGQNIVVTCGVKNNGTAFSGSNKLGYYLLEYGSGNTHYLGQHDVPGLSPGLLLGFTDTLTIPADITPGTNYYFMFFVDYLNQVNEGSYENNNEAYNYIVISSPVFSVTVSANPSEGGSVSGGVTNVPAGKSDTAHAAPFNGWSFVKWTENDQEVSTSPDYIFSVTNNRNLTANFIYMIPNAPTDLGIQINSATLHIDLTWTDNSDNEEGFYIERKNGSNGSWQVFSAVAGATFYSDSVISPGAEYFYRLRAYNVFGTSAYSNEQTIQVSGTGDLGYQQLIPDKNFLSNNYPNPFNPSTKFSFGLKSVSAVKLSVYSITGQLLDNIVDNSSMNPGIYTCIYSPDNLSSGFYLYVLRVNNSSGNFTETKKMVYIK